MRIDHRRRILAQAAVAILSLIVVVTGCSTPSPSPSHSSSSTANAVVGRDGFTVKLGDLSVVGPAGVAPSGTGVRLKPANPAEVLPKRLSNLDAQAAFDVSFDNGKQPKKPVEITWTLPEDATGGAQLGFITRNSETGEWEGLPVTVSGRTATVTLEHFSVGFFSWFTPVRDWVFDQAKKYLGLAFEKPDCAGKPLDIDGRRYSVSTDHDGVFACLDKVNGQLAVDLYSNSPFVWRYSPTTGEAKGQAPQPPAGADLSAALTIAAHGAQQGRKYDRGTVLVPNGKARILVNKGVTATVAHARVDAGLGLISVLISGIDVAMAMTTGGSGHAWFDEAVLAGQGLSELKGTGECLAQAAGAMGQDTPAQARAALGCLAPLGDDLLEGPVKGVFSVVVSIVTSLAGALVTQIMGLIGEISGSNYVTLTVSSTPIATLPGLPAALSGKWCARSDPTNCFDGAELVAKYPNAFLQDSAAPEDAPGATDYAICLERDLDDGCTMASSMFLRYFPAGVGWNCVQREVATGAWPRCVPDFTKAHDTSQPRLAVLPNHQQEEAYVDSEPLYRTS